MTPVEAILANRQSITIVAALAQLDAARDAGQVTQAQIDASVQPALIAYDSARQSLEAGASGSVNASGSALEAAVSAINQLLGASTVAGDLAWAQAYQTTVLDVLPRLKD